MFKFIASLFAPKSAPAAAPAVDLSWLDLPAGKQAVADELEYFLAQAEAECAANPTAANKARVQRAFTRLDNFYYEAYAG